MSIHKIKNNRKIRIPRNLAVASYDDLLHYYCSNYNAEKFLFNATSP